MTKLSREDYRHERYQIPGGAGGDTHEQQHGIASSADHTSGATPGNLLKADVNGLPMDSGKGVDDIEEIEADIVILEANTHARQHNLAGTADHYSTIPSTRIIMANANGLPTECDSNCTGPNLEELCDGSTTTLHEHAGEIPSGGIIMWSGTISTIPSGWYLCDGNNGTPDLRDKFIVGAKQDDGGVAKTNLEGSLTASGGSADHTHDHNHPSATSGAGSAHTHDPGSLVAHIDIDSSTKNIHEKHRADSYTSDGYVGTSGVGAGGSRSFGAEIGGATDSESTHTHSVNLPNITSDNQNDIPVPYYALAFIMKA